MLKITPQPLGPRGRVLRVEGRLAGPWVAELQDECERAFADGLKLTLELSGVHYADPQGRRLLHDLVFRSAKLVGRSPFVAAQLAAGAA